MIRAVKNYLAARHAAGFELKTECYLLFSFARFAAARGEMHIRTSTAIDWASRTVSVAQRDARLKLSVALLVICVLKTADTNCRPRVTLATARHGPCLTSIRVRRFFV